MKKNNVNIESNLKCTGCGVCSVVCPVDAIDIKLDNHGFYRPIIKDSRCTECGLCKKSCYKFLDFDENQKFKIAFENSTLYMAYTKDEEVRKTTSSGGIAYEIAKYYLKRGYKICGVEYNIENKRAEHIIIDHENDVYRIKSSKYLQSYTKLAFEKFDKDGKYVVFGTPCQIYGIRQYIKTKKIESNFILIDLFCHGIPSYLLWHKYLKHINKKYRMNNINEINFRDKRYGWHNYSMNIRCKEKNYYKTLNEDLFFRFFLSNICLNESCYKCALRLDKVYSDMRLGDFWSNKCQNDEKGVSIIAVNTEKGKEIINNLKTHIIAEQVTMKDLLESQPIRFLAKPKKYEEAMELLKKDVSLDKIYKEVLLFKYLKGNIKRFILKFIPQKLKLIIKNMLGER
jgi:coenzyme F420-reducing hydrogenase beta subunit